MLKAKSVANSRVRQKTNPTKRSVLVVAIGSGADGLRSVRTVLSDLPTKCGTAFVVIQRSDSTRRHVLRSLLSMQARLPVLEASNGVVIQPNHIYVVPPEKRASIRNGMFSLRPIASRNKHQPIDDFMADLAAQSGDKAIGVLLSGTGSDGTRGLAAIKAAHGITFAEVPPAAQGPEMPVRGLKAGVVDFVLPPAGIALELGRLARSTRRLSGQPAAAREYKTGALPKREALVDAIIGAALDAIVVMDHEGHILEFNPAAESLFGYRKTDVIGRKLADTLVPPSLRKQHRQGLTHYLSSGEDSIIGGRTEITGMRADGSEVLVELSIVRIGSRIPLFAGMMRDITERKRAEEALRESEARFRNMADSAPVLIWMSGPDKLCTWFNQQWLKFVGRTMAQEIGNGWAENVHPEDLDRCLQTYTTRFDAREQFSMEYRFRRCDGQWRWVLDSGIPRYDPDKNFAGYIGSCVDITSLKLLQEQQILTEQTLRQRENELVALFDSSPDNHLRFDSNLRVTHANAAFYKSVGVSAGSVIGRTRRELPLLRGNAQVSERLIKEVLQTGQLRQYEISFSSAKGQTEYEIRYVPESSPDGSVAAVLAIGRDITERKRIQQALRQREQELAALFDHSPDIIVRLGRDLRNLYMNAAWEKLTGIPRKTACGKMSRELGLPKTFVRLQEHSARQVLKSRGGVSFDFSYPLQAGPVDYEVRLIPEFEGSSISSILLIGRDITEQKRLQTLAASNEHDIRALSASLLSAQEQERRRVAREIHDSLCQHLGALAAEIAGLAAGFPESSQARKRLQAARERALRTAEEASQIARQLHPAILEDLGLPKALQNLCGEFSRREGIPIKLRLISPFPETPLEAASCVYRVAQEALHNVAKHAQAKHVRVRLSGTGRLHLSIQDDGKGFEPDAVRGNGGLGLVSMQERARMAGAKLAIQGRPNRGTLVDLIVPNRGATLEQATATAGR